jgi:hypothetical protein
MLLEVCNVPIPVLKTPSEPQFNLMIALPQATAALYTQKL